jgi:hypothetical protein
VFSYLTQQLKLAYYFSERTHKTILVHDASTQYKITKSNPFNIKYSGNNIIIITKNNSQSTAFKSDELQSNYIF